MADRERTFIVAEAGINHEGNLALAHSMASVAWECGCDAIKFQTHFGFNGQEQYEFTKEQWKKLFDYCDSIGLKWFSTPFDFESIDFLKECGMDIWKIPSGLITQKDFLDKINSINPKWVIMSTGMASIEEILTAKSRIKTKKLTILQCVTFYPTPYEDVNLNAMPYINLGKNYGLSDHTIGIEIPIAAAALGAEVIEKHFTLDRTMEGPDHKASIEPDEFKTMVKSIRNVEIAMGDGYKRIMPSEMNHRDEIRRIMAEHVSYTI